MAVARPLLCVFPGLLLSLLLLPFPASANEASPILLGLRPTGPLKVASTCLRISPAHAGLSATAMNPYLKGSRDGRYVTDLLEDPQATPLARFTVPDDAGLYGQEAGTTRTVAYYIIYPTTAANPRPDYAFPYAETGDPVFPRMQGPGEAPIFAEAAARYPLLILSHGYPAHPIWELAHAKYLASHGYVVAALFHGDDRASGFYHSLSRLAQRPLMVRAVIDDLLASPQFAAHLDPERIGIIGLSYGGFTALATMGGAVGGRVESVHDSRIRAGIGIVPWVGRRSAPTFGSNNTGLAGVTRPFLNICGEYDWSTAPASLDAMAHLQGNAYAVEMTAQGHLFDEPVWSAVNAWELTFLDAYLNGDPLALARLNSALHADPRALDRQRFDHQHLLPETPVHPLEAFGGAENGRPVALLGKAPPSDPALPLCYPANVNSRSLVYALEISADLDSWHRWEGAVELVAEGPTPLPAGFEWRRITLPVSPRAATPSFVRLQVRRR